MKYTLVQLHPSELAAPPIYPFPHTWAKELAEKTWGVKISDFWKVSKIPIPPSQTLMGIEIEVEGAQSNGKPYPTMPFWATHADGSLRNHGQEWVSYATTPENLSNLTLGVLQLFKKHMKDPSFSWRTSIHIHVNVQDMTEEQILNMVVLYLIFENSLFQYADIKRKHSIFCVPLLECQESLVNLLSAWRKVSKSDSKVNWGHLMQFCEKYSAMGIFRILSYGTLEFRHLPGTWDAEKIVGWICLLAALQKASISLSSDAIYEKILNINTTSFYSQFRQTVFREWDYLLAYPHYQEDLAKGVMRIKEGLFWTPNNKILKKGTAIKQLEKKLKEREAKRAELSKKGDTKFLLSLYEQKPNRKPNEEPKMRSKRLTFTSDFSQFISIATQATTTPSPIEEWNFNPGTDQEPQF